MSIDQKPAEPLDWKDEFLYLLNHIEKEYERKVGADRDRLLRYHTMIATGGFLGTRAKEMLNLSWNDIVGKTENDIFQFKQGRKRKVYFADAYIEMVNQNFQRIKPANIYDLILHKKDRPTVPISTRQFNASFARLLKRAGIHKEVPSSHTLRKTFGTYIYKEYFKSTEEGLITASQMLDHQDIEETKKYIGITDKVIKEVYRGFKAE